MAPHFKSSDENKKIKPVGSLRRSQLVTTFGSGAIADMPEYSVIMASTEYWKSHSPVLHERNLEKLLRVSCFRQPYVSENDDDKISPDIPAFRFPIMHFCPDCGRLMPYWKFGDESGKKCKKCNKNLVPSRFVAGCINGHLEDFPYSWWVHYGDFSECPAGEENDRLTISFSDESGGLEGIIITCTACGKSRSMASCLSRDALKGYHCRGKRPWIGMRSEYDDPVSCRARMQGLQRGASNVYFSQTVSALTIPPWSSQLSQEVAREWDDISSRLDAGIDEDHLTFLVEIKFPELLHSGFYTTEDILQEIDRYRNKDDSEEYTNRNLYEDEYRMFCRGNYAEPDDHQFRIEEAGVPSFLLEYVENVVMVKRLREVLALRGFRRITPEEPQEDDEAFEGYDLENDCVALSSTPLNWYPAIEMLGEGIFIRLREEKLNKWENENQNFYEPMAQRLRASNVNCENFSPRYVLLHTLSHLLIRQLSVECGYSGAAIKERIYSTYPDSRQKMAGILLYTSTSDSDGSLGGLARNARPEAFESIFRNMLQEASWCSSDPICISSKAQGYSSLNYAACHACTLLPETSCEMRNCLLDRGAVTGSLQNRDRGFFGKFLG